MQQLKNSGGLRLIRDKNAANRIIEYDAAIKDYYNEDRVLSQAQDKYIETVNHLWSFRKMCKYMGIRQFYKRTTQPVTKNYWTNKEDASFDYL